MFSLRGEDSIGLREMIFSDGPTGVRGSEFTGGSEVALFPNATLLAQSWDETAAQQVGELLAGEGVASTWMSCSVRRSTCIGRPSAAGCSRPTPRTRCSVAGWPRRTSAESRASASGARVKHYLANESETERKTVSSQVSDAALREVYLLPFEICVADANPWTIMAAYNDVNGVAATEHDELNNRLLKSEWGWDGLLMSDWGATKTTAPAANGGLDLVMPGPRGPWG